MDVIILAGGGGTRLWPLSRRNFPKQFLKLFGDRSLLQETLYRIFDLKPSNVVILSNNSQKKLIKQELEKFDEYENLHVVLEPCMKNTAPAITLGISFLRDRIKSSEDVVFITPSDSYISDVREFSRVILNSEQFCKNNEYLMTYGVPVTRVETGYGYIEKGKEIAGEIFKVVRFIEKPDFNRALELKNSGIHYWNSGMFMFGVDTYLNELKRHFKKLHSLFSNGYEFLYRNFCEVESISIDYAIMEKSDKIAMCPLTVEWNDIGSWDSFFEIESEDKEGNIIRGNVIPISLKGSLVINEDKKVVALIDMEDVIVVNTREGILIAKRGSGQKVRKVVENLEKGVKEYGRKGS